MAFLLLLGSFPRSLFSLRFLEILAIFFPAFLIGSPCLMQSNRDRLPAAFYAAEAAGATAAGLCTIFYFLYYPGLESGTAFWKSVQAVLCCVQGKGS